MGKPDASEDKATTGEEKTQPKQQPGLKGRRQVIEEYISSLREVLRRFQDRLH